MKKILSLVICIAVILCGCAKNEHKQINEVDIPFQKIAACNNRNKLLEKYGYISERTATRAQKNENFAYWIIYYEKSDDAVNAILDYAVNYKCYYYNGGVYVEYGDGQTRTVLPYREKYENVISNLLSRTDTLSYVFITESFSEKTDNGYIASYDFIVNSDILPDLEGLGVDTGSKVRVSYELNNDYEIMSCKYYRVEKTEDVEVAKIDITYGESREFPESVKKKTDENVEYVDVQIIQDFGTAAQYSEIFKVQKGTYISENDVLMQYYLYKDSSYQQMFNSFEEKITENTDIFVIKSLYIDTLLAAQEQGEEENQ